MASSVQELLKNVEAAVLERCFKVFEQLIPSLQTELSSTVAREVVNGPVGRRIMSDSRLQGDLGLERPTEAVLSIAEAVGKAARVDLERDTQSVTLSLNAFRTDFSDALRAKGAEYQSETVFKTTTIKWLEWILFGKYEALTATYGVFHLKKASMASRTFVNVMVPLKGNIRKGFQLDSMVQGDADSNWLTNAAAFVAPTFLNMLEKAFQKVGSSL